MRHLRERRRSPRKEASRYNASVGQLFPFGGVATTNDNFSGRQYLITAKHVVETAVARVLPGETVRIYSDQPPNVVKTPSSHIPPDQAKHKTTRQIRA